MEDHVLGVDAVVQTALEPDAHLPGLAYPHRLRRQHMLQLRAAAGEAERADAADGRRMAVDAEIGRAGQHEAELRHHHMGDALLRIADVKQPQAMAARRRARRIDKLAAAQTGMGLERWDRMVLHHHRQIGAADGERAPFEVLQDLRRAHVIDHDPVDIDERLAASILGQADAATRSCRTVSRPSGIDFTLTAPSLMFAF